MTISIYGRTSTNGLVRLKALQTKLLLSQTSVDLVKMGRSLNTPKFEIFDIESVHSHTYEHLMNQVNAAFKALNKTFLMHVFLGHLVLIKVTFKILVKMAILEIENFQVTR